MKALDSIRNDLFKSFKFHVFAMSDRCIWKFAYRGDKCCFVTVVLLYPQCLAYTDFKYGANKEWRVNFWVRSCTFLPLWSTECCVWQDVCFSLIQCCFSIFVCNHKQTDHCSTCYGQQCSDLNCSLCLKANCFSDASPHQAGFSRWGCLNQAAPPLSLFSYI